MRRIPARLAPGTVRNERDALRGAARRSGRSRYRGGAGGIGTAICTRFAAEGAAVYATDVAEPTTEFANIPRAASRPASPSTRHDVTSEESSAALMARVERDHGRLHVLVNAAGIEIEKTVEHTSLDEWNRIFAINVTGTFLTSKHALPLMRKAGGRLDRQLRLLRRLHRRPRPRRLLRHQGRGAPR